jgi:hypothetical protein
MTAPLSVAPDFAFWLALAAKMLVTAGIVVAASLRSGPGH